MVEVSLQNIRTRFPSKSRGNKAVAGHYNRSNRALSRDTRSSPNCFHQLPCVPAAIPTDFSQTLGIFGIVNLRASCRLVLPVSSACHQSPFSSPVLSYRASLHHAPSHINLKIPGPTAQLLMLSSMQLCIHGCSTCLIHMPVHQRSSNHLFLNCKGFGCELRHAFPHTFAVACKARSLLHGMHGCTHA